MSYRFYTAKFETVKHHTAEDHRFVKIRCLQFRKDSMRKNLEIVGLAALAFLCWITVCAFYGPSRLPAKIPTHFDLAGNPNAWGSPSMLWLLPVMAVVIYGLITLVSFFPSAFNYPVPVTPENRPRLQALSLQMVAWLKVELAFFFAFLQWFILAAVRSGHGHLSVWIVPLFLVLVFGTCIGYIVAMVRAAPPRMNTLGTRDSR
jgi:uncharacterized membrane protein